MIAFFRECLCTCCLGWQEGMRDSWIFPYFFPYAVTVIRTYWYVMQQSGIELGNNDPKSGILTTYGIIPCNSNSSSEQSQECGRMHITNYRKYNQHLQCLTNTNRKPHHLVWLFFFSSSEGFENRIQAASGSLVAAGWTRQHINLIETLTRTEFQPITTYTCFIRGESAQRTTKTSMALIYQKITFEIWKILNFKSDFQIPENLTDHV